MSNSYLRFRWENGYAVDEYLCHYELVLFLSRDDIRREIWKDGEITGKRDSIVISMNEGPTRRNSYGLPCVNGNGYFYDAPFRDGAHAIWDSAKLGGLPIKAMAIDGTMIDYVPIGNEIR